MFKKVLIANRGEIALRVIKTCKKLGISTVAIYSDADQDALHVMQADEAYYVGAARVQESYLNSSKILEIAKETNSEAIHPGYGFLSESANFAIACEKAGVTFIGPTSEVIKKMGNKLEARRTMEALGVPIVPGVNVSLSDEKEAIQCANDLGYPIMLKAASGGGGIGMQLVNNEQELMKTFESNQKRATMFFGNGEMYLEKFIENPRHIEVQLLADKHGNVVHLWERECSIQRRHQKVIEEAPSIFLDEETRTKMVEVAVNAARKLGYVNAGTMEFLVDEKKNFYFLEMNTRLQVEHPVTEEITGIDIVEQQLRVAVGEKLALEKVAKEGHSIEARIYAEDPKTFFPSPGKITKMAMPKDVRLELGVTEGTQVTTFYDPMLGKLIVTGKNRHEAVMKLQIALAEVEIEGIKTNLPLLKKISNHTSYEEGNITTNFIAELYLQI